MKKFPPLPVFPPITIPEIPSGSALEFYGGNKFTEFYGNHRKEFWGGKACTQFPYTPPPFHTAHYQRRGYFFNVGMFRTIKKLEGELLSTRRVDVIIYKEVTPDLGERIADDMQDDADKPGLFKRMTYAVQDYARFEPALRWLIPEDKKRDFCTEDKVRRMLQFGIKTSARPPAKSAPWDDVLYALAHPKTCELRTLHVGADFAKTRAAT
jgi:hypothetical protein